MGLSYILNLTQKTKSVEHVNTTREALEYTHHAQCRMSCREIDENEVREVLVSGEINQKKSEPQAQPCPVEVREKRVPSGQRVRVVFGKCRGQTKIITVIDLDNEHECNCR